MSSNKKALVVDENLESRIALGRMFDWLGIQVVQASNGADAVSIYEEDPSFDIVVIGGISKGVDRLTITRLIRQYQVAKRPYIVGAGVSEESGDKLLKAGMDSYFVTTGSGLRKNKGAAPVIPIFGPTAH